MGVTNLWHILSPVQHHEPLSSLKGQTIAVDLSIWVCETQCVKQMQGTVSKPFLRNLFFRVCHLLHLGVHLVFVVEGDAPELKWEAMWKRQESRYPRQPGGKTNNRRHGRGNFKACLRECCELLDLLGIPHIQSRGEAEALCALLNATGLVDGCITNDGDAFLYGATTVYRNFTMNSKDPHVESYQMTNIKSQLGLDQQKLVAMALLLGCDYLPKGVPGVGMDKAVKLIKSLHHVNVLHRFEKWKFMSDSECIDAVEVVVKRKAASVSDFPQHKVIAEFLEVNDKCPTKLPAWKRPKLNSLKEFSLKKLEWPEEYTTEKVLPLMTLWDMTSILKAGDAGKNRYMYLKPHIIVKSRVRQGVNCYEVQWFKEATDISSTEDYYTTVEEQGIFSRCFSQLVSQFEEQKAAKKTKSKGGRRKKKEADKKNEVPQEGAVSIQEDAVNTQEDVLNTQQDAVNSQEVSPFDVENISEGLGHVSLSDEKEMFRGPRIIKADTHITEHPKQRSQTKVKPQPRTLSMEDLLSDDDFIDIEFHLENKSPCEKVDECEIKENQSQMNVSESSVLEEYIPLSQRIKSSVLLNHRQNVPPSDSVLNANIHKTSKRSFLSKRSSEEKLTSIENAGLKLDTVKRDKISKPLTLSVKAIKPRDNECPAFEPKNSGLKLDHDQKLPDFVSRPDPGINTEVDVEKNTLLSSKHKVTSVETTKNNVDRKMEESSSLVIENLKEDISGEEKSGLLNEYENVSLSGPELPTDSPGTCGKENSFKIQQVFLPSGFTHSFQSPAKSLSCCQVEMPTICGRVQSNAFNETTDLNCSEFNHVGKMNFTKVLTPDVTHRHNDLVASTPANLDCLSVNNFDSGQSIELKSTPLQYSYYGSPCLKNNNGSTDSFDCSGMKNSYVQKPGVCTPNSCSIEIDNSFSDLKYSHSKDILQNSLSFNSTTGSFIEYGKFNIESSLLRSINFHSSLSETPSPNNLKKIYDNRVKSDNGILNFSEHCVDIGTSLSQVLSETHISTDAVKHDNDVDFTGNRAKTNFEDPENTDDKDSGNKLDDNISLALDTNAEYEPDSGTPTENIHENDPKQETLRKNLRPELQLKNLDSDKVSCNVRNKEFCQKVLESDCRIKHSCDSDEISLAVESSPVALIDRIRSKLRKESDSLTLKKITGSRNVSVIPIHK